MIRWYLRWTSVEVAWWHCWDPRSGVIGGAVLGCGVFGLIWLWLWWGQVG
jgi:hypothetical protein